MQNETIRNHSPAHYLGLMGFLAALVMASEAGAGALFSRSFAAGDAPRSGHRENKLAFRQCPIRDGEFNRSTQHLRLYDSSKGDDEDDQKETPRPDRF